MAIDDHKRAYSWGFGGYGRLGHSEPKDELQPRLIKYFDVQRSGVKYVACGPAFSIAINEFGINEICYENTFYDVLFYAIC